MNPQPFDYKSNALPIVLQEQKNRRGYNPSPYLILLLFVKRKTTETKCLCFCFCSICGYNLKHLSIIMNTEYSILIRIINKLNKSSSIRWIETNFNRCKSSEIVISKINCKIVTLLLLNICTKSSIIIYIEEFTRNSTVSNRYTILKFTYIFAE